jgi:hypothetical protein
METMSAPPPVLATADETSASNVPSVEAAALLDALVAWLVQVAAGDASG